MAWLLERGASLTLVSRDRSTIAHVLMSALYAAAARTAATPTTFVSHWLRRVVSAEPSLLEARDRLGATPLTLAALAGSNACVDVPMETAAGCGSAVELCSAALSTACTAVCLIGVRHLIAADAASAAVLPPGSPQARNVAAAAVYAARSAERGCGSCRAPRCGGVGFGDCADGLDILRAVLAAGVREAMDADGHSLAAMVLRWMHAADDSKRVSAEHALTILQTLHTAGVDVLARGPADTEPVLHAVALADAPAVVRWLVTVAGAPLEGRCAGKGATPLLLACHAKAWAAAHALLDCGARVDVQSANEAGWWPVLSAVESVKFNDTLLLRLLAADCDSLLRCAAGGASALHYAAVANTPALNLLLGSGLPHLAKAINAVAQIPMESRSGDMSFTPLHGACEYARWDAALALLAAGARVDIAGDIEGKLQTIAEWARSSPACKHRGVKLAIAARAREHAAQARTEGAGAGGTVSRTAGETASATAAVAAAAPSATAAGLASGLRIAASGSGPEFCAGAIGAAGAVVATAAAPHLASTRKLTGKLRKGRLGAVARNRAEDTADDASAGAEIPSDASALVCAGPCIGVPLEAAAAPSFVALNSREAGLSEAAVSAGAAHANATVISAPAASAATPSGATAVPAAGECAPVNNSLFAAPTLHSSGTARQRWPDAAPLAGSTYQPCEASLVTATVALSDIINTCESGGEAAASTNTCEPGGKAAASTNTCEPDGEAAASTNTCEPGGEAAASTNTCEPGGEAASVASDSVTGS